MFSDLEYPHTISSKELDLYLGMGWYRMGQSMFTTNFLRFNDVFYSALWLRIPVENYQRGSTYQKLKKLNSGFKIVIEKTGVDEEKELLFQEYKASLSFEASSSLSHLLYSEGDGDIFNSITICLYDCTRLIACGILDLGENSSAGITCFYHPSYKNHSLGKYLMFLKIDYCIEHKIKYFYPGYFAPGYTLFDYKTNLSKNNTQYYNYANNSWQIVTKQLFTENPLAEIRDRLTVFSDLLSSKNIAHTKYDYIFYDANLIPDFYKAALFDQPQFIAFSNIQSSSFCSLMYYDIYARVYKLAVCQAVYKTNHESNDNQIFKTHLLKPIEYIVDTETAEEMLEILMKSLVEK